VCSLGAWKWNCTNVKATPSMTTAPASARFTCTVCPLSSTVYADGW
jgi:hypothetical protein